MQILVVEDMPFEGIMGENQLEGLKALTNHRKRKVQLHEWSDLVMKPEEVKTKEKRVAVAVAKVQKHRVLTCTSMCRQEPRLSACGYAVQRQQC